MRHPDPIAQPPLHGASTAVSRSATTKGIVTIGIIARTLSTTSTTAPMTRKRQHHAAASRIATGTVRPELTTAPGASDIDGPSSHSTG